MEKPSLKAQQSLQHLLYQKPLLLKEFRHPILLQVDHPPEKWLYHTHCIYSLLLWGYFSSFSEGLSEKEFRLASKMTISRSFFDDIIVIVKLFFQPIKSFATHSCGRKTLHPFGFILAQTQFCKKASVAPSAAHNFPFGRKVKQQ